MRIAVSSDERDGRRRGASSTSCAAAATSRCSTARSPTASAPTGRGRARPPRATSPRAAPTRRVVCCWTGHRRVDRREQGPGHPRRAVRRRADRRGRAQVERRERPGARRCARPRRPSSRRSSTPGSPARRRPTTTTARTSAHLAEIDAAVTELVPLDRARPRRGHARLVRHARRRPGSSRCPSGSTACAASTSAPGTASGRSRWSAAAPPRSSRSTSTTPTRWDWPPRERLQPERLAARRCSRRSRGAARASAIARRAARLARSSGAERSVYDLDPTDARPLRRRLPRLAAAAPARPGPRARAPALRSAPASPVIADTVELVPVAALRRARRVARLEGATARGGGSPTAPRCCG